MSAVEMTGEPQKAEPVSTSASDLAAVSSQCLRWRDRLGRHRPAGEPFEPHRYLVEPIEEHAAKAFVLAHHYSGSYPAARYRVGLFEQPAARARSRASGASARLAGVAVFSVPMAQAVVPKYLPGLTPNEGVELGRFVLLDEIPGNAESWFLARAMRLLKRDLPRVGGVVSFCDPLARFDAGGRQVKHTHTGVIYRAHNARVAGRTAARTLLLMPDGRCANERLLSKIRTGERGADYAREQLVAAGAERRMLGETPTEWLARLRAEGFLRSLRHPGNLAFAWRW